MKPPGRARQRSRMRTCLVVVVMALSTLAGGSEAMALPPPAGSGPQVAYALDLARAFFGTDPCPQGFAITWHTSAELAGTDVRGTVHGRGAGCRMMLNGEWWPDGSFEQRCQTVVHEFGHSLPEWANSHSADPSHPMSNADGSKFAPCWTRYDHLRDRWCRLKRTLKAVSRRVGRAYRLARWRELRAARRAERRVNRRMRAVERQQDRVDADGGCGFP